MIVKSDKQEGNFTLVPNDLIYDNRLSWKAKGLLLYLLSKPPNWKPHPGDLLKQSTDGTDSIKSGMKELRKYGYAEIILKRQQGKFTSREYVIYESPLLNKNFKQENPPEGNSSTSETPSISNTELNNIETNDIDSNNSDW